MHQLISLSSFRNFLKKTGTARRVIIRLQYRIRFVISTNVLVVPAIIIFTKSAGINIVAAGVIILRTVFAGGTTGFSGKCAADGNGNGNRDQQDPDPYHKKQFRWLNSCLLFFTGFRLLLICKT
jgi:hypothetical protein